MKKTIAAALCLCASLLFSGCGLDQIKEKYIEETEASPTITQAPRERVYMDQFTGKVQDFDGSNLVLNADGRTVLFGASQASVETSHGLLYGDEVSVIYEGRLDSEEPSDVKILKVVDDLHKEAEPEEQTIRGTLIRLTQNALLFEDTAHRQILCPVAGTSQYYRSGIREGMRITVKYLGTIPDIDPGEGRTLEVPLIRVQSVSDTGTIPEKPAVSSEAAVTNDYGDEIRVSTTLIRGHIRSLENDQLQVIPNGAEDAETVDLSSCECWFPGGFCSGTGVDLVCSGGNEENSLAGAAVHTAVGDDPSDLSSGDILSYVSGEIVGLTANTVTLRTSDEVSVTLRTDSVPNAAGELLYGSNIRVLFDPEASRETNVLQSLRIRSSS